MNTMTHQEFMGHVLRPTMQSVIDLSEGKGKEYAGPEGSSNEHANFDRLAVEMEMSPEKVLAVYWTKHMDAIKTYVRTLNKDTSEPIEGRIDDAILYLLLLKGMVIRRRSKTSGGGGGQWVPSTTQTVAVAGVGVAGHHTHGGDGRNTGGGAPPTMGAGGGSVVHTDSMHDAIAGGLRFAKRSPDLS